jgi:hypothetical protein
VLRLAIDDNEAILRKAALRVVTAAKPFGSEQEAQARAWVDEAIESDASTVDIDTLLAKQLTLFEECLIDDEGGKCKELDAALTALESQLKVTNVAKGIKVPFETVKLERALARVRKAAGKFGTEQARYVAAWTDQVRATRSANPAGLLAQQSALFDECVIDEDGSQCQELEESLATLQAALGVRGQVVSTAALRND